MKIEDQVCSLELAQKLKELGVNQDSLFIWYQDDGGFGLILSAAIGIQGPQWAAFTVAELGEMLPEVYVGSCQKRGDLWFWSAAKAFGPAKSEADARAKMLIYLVEKGLAKPR